MPEVMDLSFDVHNEIANHYGVQKSSVSRNDITDDFGTLSVYKIEQLLRRGVRVMDLPLTVAFYARVSTDEEVQLHSLGSQIGYYERMIRANPNWTLFRGYWDEGISGTSVKNREQFAGMIRDGFNHKFDLIITKEISRFARNTMDSLQYTRELLRRGVGVYFESDGILTLEPDSEFRLTIMSSVAQEESRKTSERVKRGNRISVENHVVLGSGRIYGYNKVQGKLTVNEREAAMVRMMFDLFTNKLYGLKKIARALYDKGYRNYNGGRISETTIQRILRNPKYKGYYCGGKTTKHRHLSTEVIQIPEENWVMFKDESGSIVPALISEELWDRTQILLERKRQAFVTEGSAVNFKGSYPYSGKIVCEAHRQAYCRGLYRNKRKDGSVLEREVWQCLSYIKQGRRACDKPTLYSDELNEIVADLIDRLLENKEAVTDEIKHICAEAANGPGREALVKEMETEIDAIRKRRDKLLDILLAGRVSDAEFDVRNKAMSDEIAEKETALAEVRKQAQNVPDLYGNSEAFCQAIRWILDFKDGFSRRVIDSLLDLIVVKKESTKNDIVLDIYLRCQEYAAPLRFVKRKDGKRSLQSTELGWQREPDRTSSVFPSTKSPEKEEKRSELALSSSIFTPKEVLWWS